MSRNLNYTGRHAEAIKDTTRTPPTKMSGPVRSNAGDKISFEKKAKAPVKRKPRKWKYNPEYSVTHLLNPQYGW